MLCFATPRQRRNRRESSAEWENKVNCIEWGHTLLLHEGATQRHRQYPRLHLFQPKRMEPKTRLSTARRKSQESWSEQWTRWFSNSPSSRKLLHCMKLFVMYSLTLCGQSNHCTSSKRSNISIRSTERTGIRLCSRLYFTSASVMCRPFYGERKYRKFLVEYIKVAQSHEFPRISSAFEAQYISHQITARHSDCSHRRK